MELFQKAGKPEDQLLSTKLYIPIVQPGWIARRHLIEQNQCRVAAAIDLDLGPCRIWKNNPAQRMGVYMRSKRRLGIS